MDNTPLSLVASVSLAVAKALSQVEICVLRSFKKLSKSVLIAPLRLAVAVSI